MPNWFYFPCAPGEKVPALEGDWRSHATDNEQQIQRWLDAGYNLALDCERSGVAVLDIDGPAGESSLSALGPLPDTYEVQTPRGGRHLYFVGEIASSVQGLGPKLDTRGRGGYVLVAPSATAEGRYEAVNALPLATLPEHVQGRLRKREKAQTSVEELDLPQNITRARAYLDALPAAVEGEGGNDATYQAACRMKELGVSDEVALDLMLTHWNDRCDPPWEVDELQIVIDNAFRYAQNEAGAWAITSGKDTFAEYAALQALEPRERGPFDLLGEAEQDELKPATWLMPDFWPDKTLTMLYGAPGSFKSFIALDAALTMAAGVEAWDMPAAAPRPVIYVAGEGPRSVARLRRPAWRTSKGLAHEIPFHLVVNMPHPAFEGEVEQFIQAVEASGVKPAGVIIDTLARFMAGLDENSAKDCGVVIGALDLIRNRLGCGVLVVHHAGKEEGRGPRGSSALIGGFDTLHECVAHKATKALAVHNRLQKDADERSTPWHFEGHVVENSLVFKPISAADHKALTVAEDALAPRAIGAALLAMGAKGERTVSTHALAGKLYQGAQDEPAEVTLAAVDRLVRQLRAASRGRLEPYCTRPDGKELAWGLPS